MRTQLYRVLCCALLLPLLVFGQSAPQPSEDWKREYDALRREIEQMREALERSSRQIDELKAEVNGAKPAAAPAPAPAAAEPESELKERVTEVEQEMVNNRLMENRRLELHTYGEVNFEKFQNNRSVFDPRLVEIILSGRPVNRLRFFSEIEFERVAALGDRRGGEIAVEQGWIELTLKDWLRPRAGVVPVPFGYYNQNHFVTQQDHVDRPLLGRVIVPGTWSDVAFGFTGQGARKAINWTYEAYLTQGLQQGISNRGLREARPAFGADNNGNKAFAGQFRVTSGPYYRAGFSYYKSQFDTLGRQSIRGVALDGKWGRGPFEMMAEYARFNTTKGLVPVPSLLHGVSTEAKWTMRPRWVRNSFLGEGFEDPRIELVARFEKAWIDTEPGTNFRDERRVTVGLNYRPNIHFVAKTGYQFNTSKNFSLQRGNLDGWMSSIAFYF